ncbi:hypothetical protein ACP70R_044414 [Stipagrostis hirtigluma subsp. patula]
MADAPPHALTPPWQNARQYKSARFLQRPSSARSLYCLRSAIQLVHPSPAVLLYREANRSVEMEMEKMMGCRIPAFGIWNYCHDLPITQYFDSAVQTRLTKRRNRRGDGEFVGGGGGDPMVLFRTASFQRKPAQIKVIRREVEKHCNGGEQQDGGVQAGADEAYAMKRKVACRAVDEDLYKVPQPLLCQKPKKV